MNEVYEEIERHIPDLRRYARAIAHGPIAAEDLVQESLMRALAKSHLYRPGTNLRAWLFTILHNRHISNMRRNGRTGISVDPDDVPASLSSLPNQEASLTLKSAAKALAMLPDEQRILIELVVLNGKSYEEVAEAYDLPIGTIKSRISRGRRQMRDALDGHDRAARAAVSVAPGAGRPRGKRNSDSVPLAACRPARPDRSGRSARADRTPSPKSAA